jgi:hypothetical protein
MKARIPQLLLGERNRKVLNYLRGKSAHSDIDEVLFLRTRKLPGTELYCDNPKNFGYCFAYANDVIFGFAEGMHGISLRLPTMLAASALKAHAEAVPDAGPEWFFFHSLGNATPSGSVRDWVYEAHLFALGD